MIKRINKFIFEQYCIPWFILKRLRSIFDIAKELKRIKKINLEKTFVGGFSTYNGIEWAEKSSDYNRLGLLLKDSPYVDFLKSYGKLSQISEIEFLKTDYYNMALQCIKVDGSFFGIKKPIELIKQANYFLAMFHFFKNKQTTKSPFYNKSIGSGHSSSSYCKVLKFLDIDYYEIFDGHHRLAIQYVLGNKFVKVSVFGETRTYLQNLVFKVNKTEGRKELY